MRRTGMLLALLAASATAGAGEFDQAVIKLGSDDATSREAARKKLIEGGPEAATALVAYLEHLTIKLGPRVAALVAQLDDARWKTREQATRRLERIGAPALPALERAARSSNPEVAWRAKAAAERIRREDRGEAARRMRRRVAVVRLLAETAPPGAVAVLSAELDCADDATIPPLAAFGLGRIGRPEAGPALRGKLGSADWLLRIHVIWALGATGDAGSVQPLLALARDQEADRYLRARAAGALRRIGRGRREAARGLAGLLDDAAWEVRAAAGLSLRELKGKSLGYRYDAAPAERAAPALAWRKWADGLLPDGGDGR